MCCPMWAGTACWCKPRCRHRSDIIRHGKVVRVWRCCREPCLRDRGRLHEQAGRDGRARARRPARSSRPGSCTCCSGAPPRCPQASPTRAWPTGTASPATCALPTPRNPVRARWLCQTRADLGCHSNYPGVCDGYGTRPRASRTYCAAAVRGDRHLSLLPSTRTARGCAGHAPAVGAAPRAARCRRLPGRAQTGRARRRRPPAGCVRCSPALRGVAADAQAAPAACMPSPAPRAQVCNKICCGRANFEQHCACKKHLRKQALAQQAAAAAAGGGGGGGLAGAPVGGAALRGEPERERATTYVGPLAQCGSYCKQARSPRAARRARRACSADRRRAAVGAVLLSWLHWAPVVCLACGAPRLSPGVRAGRSRACGHRRRARAPQVITTELNCVTDQLLQQLQLWQERARSMHPLQGGRHKRIVSGLRCAGAGQGPPEGSLLAGQQCGIVRHARCWTCCVTGHGRGGGG